jgi:hypothetical protein
LTVADPLLWHAGGTAHRVHPRRAKVRTVTLRELGSVLIQGQGDSVRACRWFPVVVSPRGNGRVNGQVEVPAGGQIKSPLRAGDKANVLDHHASQMRQQIRKIRRR